MWNARFLENRAVIDESVFLLRICTEDHEKNISQGIICIPLVKPNSPLSEHLPGRGIPQLDQGVMNVQDVRLGRSVGIAEEERLRKERIDQMGEPLRKGSHSGRIA